MDTEKASSRSSINIAKLANDCPTHREHLIIVTDGQVGESDIKQSDNLMNYYNIKFKFVSFYAIGSEADLSVRAPFCRNCPNKTIHVLNANQRMEKPSISFDEISALNKLLNINTIQEFNSEFNKLQSAIKAKQLGKNGGQDLMFKLLAFKNRIINGLSWSQKTEFENKWKELYDMARNGA